MNRPLTGSEDATDVRRRLAVIHERLERRSIISRTAAGRTTEEQVIAANVDTLFLVTAFAGDLNPRRLERYLISVWNAGASPVVVVNKSDLAEDSEAAAQDLRARLSFVDVVSGRMYFRAISSTRLRKSLRNARRLCRRRLCRFRSVRGHLLPLGLRLEDRSCQDVAPAGRRAPRQEQGVGAPDPLAHGRPRAAQPRGSERYGGDHPINALAAGEGAEVTVGPARALERYVLAVAEELGLPAPELEAFPGHVELDAAVAPPPQQLGLQLNPSKTILQPLERGVPANHLIARPDDEQAVVERFQDVLVERVQAIELRRLEVELAIQPAVFEDKPRPIEILDHIGEQAELRMRGDEPDSRQQCRQREPCHGPDRPDDPTPRPHDLRTTTTHDPS